MRRILVAGLPGSGKTTTARVAAGRLGVPWYDVDALYYGPGMVMRPEFVPEAYAIAAQETWVLDSMGPRADLDLRDHLWDRADTVVWLDLSWPVSVTRAVRRSLRRSITRELLWQGYQDDPWQWRLPGHPVNRAVREHGAKRADLVRRVGDTRWRHLDIVRLRSTREVNAWLGAIPQTGDGAPSE